MGIKAILAKIANAFLDYILKPILKLSWQLYYRNLDHLQPLNEARNPLLFTPAWKLAQKIRKREVTCLEVVQTFIDRIKEVQPLLNFMVYDCFDEAIEQAKKYDEILNSASIPEIYSEENAPLLGVPFTCKESLWVKGKPNSTGLLKRKDFRAPEDSYVVKYARESGAIILCLTNTSELCFWFETSNYLYGASRNPYNLSRIVGGSSGGEGCAVGSGASIFGLGSDIGGSIRIPSCLNGVYGHMPTPNTVISNDWQYPTGLQQCMLGTGPICRYASDLRLLFKVLCGPQYSQIQHKFESNVDVNNLKFYVIRGMQGHPLITELNDDVKNALNKAVLFIEDKLGRPVQEIRPKKLKLAFQMWSSLANEGQIGQRSFCKKLNDNENEPINAFKELVKSMCGMQKEHTLPSILIALKEQLGIYEPEKFIQVGNEFRKEMQDILGDDGVLIFPSFPTDAPYHNIAAFVHNFDFIYFGIFNMLGFPATQCPMGLSSRGMPIGVQVVANRFNDHLTIKMAEIFEAQLGGWVKPF